MLFLIFVVILIVGLIWHKKEKWDEIRGIVTSAIGIAAIVISIAIMAFNYIPTDAYVDAMNTRYDTLVYQYENKIYENDNDLGKRELMTDIQSWNEDLAYKQKIQDNTWYLLS